MIAYTEEKKPRKEASLLTPRRYNRSQLMATYCLTQLVIVILNIFLVVLSAVANEDFCGSVFETQLDHALVGHVMRTTVVADEFECQFKCLGNSSCKSFNVHPYGNISKRLKCELNSKTRQMKPRDFQWRRESTYYGSVQVSCLDVSRDQNGQTKRDCLDLLNSGYTQSGEYLVNPDGKGQMKVYCDMHTDGGGWTVFHRRQDGSVDFYRGWNDYKAGFGLISGEFWLGNDKIHRLTASRPSTLRELEDWHGIRVHAKYGKFNIGDEQAQYRLEVGSYTGTAKDSFGYHNNMPFSTKDRENDIDSSRHCAIASAGAWWYKFCQYTNLNGQYLGEKSNYQGVRWYHFRRNLSLKFAEMKIRPLL